MSVVFSAETLEAYRWLERTRCAAIGLAIHSGILLMCLLTTNPLLKGVPPPLIGILFVSVFIDAFASFCLFYGFQKKKRWMFLPIMIKQGAEAVVRSLMLFGLLVVFFEHLKNSYDPDSGRRSPNDRHFGTFQIFVFLLPFNITSLHCFIKAFNALRPASPIHVTPRDSFVPRAAKALQNFLWMERARCVAIGLSIYESIFLLFLVTANPLLESKCIDIGGSVLYTVVAVFCLAACFYGIRRKEMFLVLPIMIQQVFEAVVRTGIIIQLICTYIVKLENMSDPAQNASPEDVCSGVNQIFAFFLPLHIIAFYCFSKILWFPMPSLTISSVA